MKIQKKCDWLFVFFIHEIPEYQPFLEGLLTIISIAGNKPAYTIWVVLDKAVADADNLKGHFQLEVLTFDLDGDPYKLTPVPLSMMGIDDGDANRWIPAFNYIFKNVECNRRSLFTWSHGSGFGINAEAYREFRFAKHQTYFHYETEKRASVVEVVRNYSYLSSQQVHVVNSDKMIPIIREVPLQKGEFRIVEKAESFDCGKLDLLWMSEFAKGLEDLELEKPIDLMLMINCNMQLFENGYMLRKTVDILVGPESLMWAYGYDYAKIFQYVNDNSKIDPKALAIKIVDDYKQMHQQMGHDEYLDNTTLFANLLEVYEPILDVLQKTTAEIGGRLGEVREEINKLRANYFKNVSGRYAIFLLDLELWIKTLYEEHLLLSPDPAQLTKFLELKEKARIAKHIGASIIKADNTGPGKFGHGGCSLFFPRDGKFTPAGRTGWCEYLSGQRTSSFQEASNWDEFIKQLNA